MKNLEAALTSIPALEKFYKRYRLCLAVRGLAEFCLRFWGALLLAGLSASWMTAESARLAVLWAWGLASLWLLREQARKWKQSSGPAPFCRFLESRSQKFRDLLNGAELASGPEREGISSDIIRALTLSLQARLENEEPARWLPFTFLKGSAKPAGILLLVTAALVLVPPRPMVSGLNRLFLGSRDEFFRHLSVSPRGGRTAMGEAVAVEAELLREDGPEPSLYVSGRSGWEKVRGRSEGRKTRFELKPVIEEVRYRVKWKNLESPVFELTPVDPPRLTGFEVKLIYPDYTGVPAQTLEEEPQIRTWRGTRVQITAKATRDLAEIRMRSSLGWVHPVAIEKGNRVRAEFTVNNSFEFWFEMRDAEGLSPAEPARYAVSLREDQPPRIRILAPAADIIAGKETRIPFTFEAGDDMGVRAVYLRVQRGEGGGAERILLRRYPAPQREKTDDAAFSLAALKTFSGEILRMRLEAQDNDDVTGPKSGFSETILVEVQSYEKEHAEIEKELSRFREDLVGLLAEQTEARLPDSEWKALRARPESFQNKADEIYEKQARAVDEARRMGKNLEKTLARLEKDPLSDFTAYSEHRALKEALESLREGAMTRARETLGRKNAEEALGDQDEAVAGLERLSSLSEEIQKYSRMKDLMHAADRLAEKGELLNEKLSANAAMDEGLRRLLEETLKEAAEILSEMARQLKDLPGELPEDFVNKPALQKMSMGEMAESMKNLSQSLRSGDAAAALRAAQELLRQAKAARDAIAKAAEEVSVSSSGDLAQSAQNSQSALDKIIERQENLLEKTNRFDAKRKQALLDAQKSLLAELAERQKSALRTAGLLLDELRPLPRTYVGPMAGMLEPALPKMEKVHKEFRERNVLFSQKWLGEIAAGLEASGAIVETFRTLERSTQTLTPEDAAKMKVMLEEAAYWKKILALKKEEESILEKLRNPSAIAADPFDEKDRAGLAALAEDQDALADDTRRLRGDISRLAARSALVDPAAAESLKSAEGEMKNAALSLKAAESERARGEEEKALSHLRRGQDSLESLQQNLKKTAGSGGQSRGGIQERGSSGGSTGARRGVVRIPGAEEYLPPREFREEILDALKEKYPKSEENVIKDYFKKLAQ